MTEKTYYLEDVGNIKLRKSKQSKNVSISIKPNKGVVVTIPIFLSYKHGINILEQKKNWVKKHLPKIKELEQKSITFDENSVFKTSKRQLVIKKHKLEKLIGSITESHIRIYYPENLIVTSTETQEFIQKTIIEALRMEAKEYLPKRLDEISNKLNIPYNKVFIKNHKTLWGSCSGKNNINLNLHLIRLPQHLRDYVIIHELCHTIQMNHGPKFWRLMDSILGDSKMLSKELKQYRIAFS